MRPLDRPLLDRLLLDPRNGPDHDRPAPEPGVRAYVVCSMPRSGSTLLCRLLGATGDAGVPAEHLNPMQLRDWGLRAGGPRGAAQLLLWGPAVGALAGRIGWGPERVGAHLDRLRQRRSAGGWYGLKLHHHHLVRHFGARAPLRGLEAHLGPLTLLRIGRRDRLAQAVSWERALQSGQWASWQRRGLPPVYSRRRIGARLRELDAGEAGWDAILGDRPHARLWFEDLVADPTAALNAARAALGLAPLPAAPPVPDLRPQGGGAAWVARYRAGT
jgi:LPS sulfotransferase NodH